MPGPLQDLIFGLRYAAVHYVVEIYFSCYSAAALSNPNIHSYSFVGKNFVCINIEEVHST